MYRTCLLLALLVASVVATETVSPADTGWHVQLSGAAPGEFTRACDVDVDSGGNPVAVGRLANQHSFEHDFVIVKFAADDGMQLWRRELDADAADDARAVTMGAADEVVVGGRLGGFAVVKLDASGGDVWSTIVDPSKTGWVDALALGAAGQVFASGGLVDANQSDFAIVRLDGASGTEVWRYVIDGSETDPLADQRDEAVAVVVDAGGDVFAGGWLRNAGVGPTFTVVRLDGASGAETWRNELDPSGRARALALDSAGDVFAAGVLYETPSYSFAVVKLDGTSGAELWRRRLDGGEIITNDALAVQVDAAGDVIAAGELHSGSASRADFAVVKLAGASGAEIWRTVLSSGGVQEDVANDVVVDADGDVFAVGRLARRKNAPGFAMTTVKLDGATGAILWLREADATHQGSQGFDQAFGVALDAAGNAVVAGALAELYTGLDFTVMKLDGQTGLTIDGCPPAPLEGCYGAAGAKSKLKIADRTLSGGAPNRNDKLKWSRIGAVRTAFAEFGRLLAVADLRLCIYDAVGGTPVPVAQAIIPGGGTCRGNRACWKVVGGDTDSVGYEYKDTQATKGGVRKLRMTMADAKRRKLLLSGRGARLPLPGPVAPDAYFAQNPSLVLQVAATAGACWEVEYAADAATANRADLFSARCRDCP